MAYSSKGGKPNEYASKSSHSYIINDPLVKNFLNSCSYPKTSENIELSLSKVFEVPDIVQNPIKSIVAIDGGYTDIPVKKEFPSSILSFFQFGALFFNISALEEIHHKPFIDPKDMSKLQEIERFKLVLPIKNVVFKEDQSLKESFRDGIYTFFLANPKDDSFMQTLKWFIFEEYEHPKDSWTLSSCPICLTREIELNRKKMSNEYTFKCPSCNSKVLLTDVFRLHEEVDEELGATGVSGYIITMLEQLILVHLIRIIINTKPSLLNEILFIKDGPLGFFGQTANLHKPMRKLINYVVKNQDIHLAGLEKSGPFVEHANEISRKLANNSVLILDNDYIYKYIIPGRADPNNPYGKTTYYGNKVIYKTDDEKIYVITLPTKEINSHPKKEDLLNLDIVLKNIEKLKCDMYNSALFPISLVNKLVSLSNHPSSEIIEKFAKKNISS